MTATLLTLADCQLLLLAVGWRARERNRTMDDFHPAGRNPGPAVAALSDAADGGGSDR